jgi:flagellar hook-associated protein 1 FlgK
MAGLLSNAISGLQASQTALRTAGNNIANANTEGYSRQNVAFGTRPAQNIGSAGYLGNGVNTETIARVADDFVATQLRLDTSSFNQLDAYGLNLSKIDSLLANSSTGLAGGLQQFFAALQGAADDPANTPSRQLVVDQAQGVADRFNHLYDRFNTIGKSIEAEVATITGQINSQANTIAELNKAIIEKRGASGGEPNDLLDKRDTALKQLSELVGVTVVSQDAGSLNVYIGNGQPLVVGQDASQLTSDGNGHVLFRTTGSDTDITAQISGGKMGGLLTFNQDVLHPAKNELGRVALVLAGEMNRLQGEGLNLDGDYGEPLFTELNNPAAVAGRVTPLNGSSGSITANISDTSLLTSSDYTLRVSGGNYTVVRESDGQIAVPSTALPGTAPTPGSPFNIDFEGVSLELTSALANGESYRISPTTTAARDIQAIMDDPRGLALAAPVRTEANSANAGNAVISAGKVQSNPVPGPSNPVVPLVIDTPAAPPATYDEVNIEFISSAPTPQYKFVDSAGNDFAPAPTGSPFTYTPGEPIYLESPVGAAGTAYEFTIQGNPAAGDTFSISFNHNAANDNRTGLKMAALVSTETVEGGLSINGAYTKLVEQVGAKSNLARMNTDAARSVLEQTQSLRDSISGVNLDEEAADLIKFEQAYNANSQVIAIARQVFDSLLNAF